MMRVLEINSRKLNSSESEMIAKFLENKPKKKERKIRNPMRYSFK